MIYLFKNLAIRQKGRTEKTGKAENLTSCHEIVTKWQTY
jgi:hypothetical protein